MTRKLLAAFLVVLMGAPAGAMTVDCRKLSSTAYVVYFGMKDSSDHTTDKTGLTITANCSKNGGSYGACSGAVTEVGNGTYYIAGNATDRNTLGPLAYRMTAAGADPNTFVLNTTVDDCFASSADFWAYGTRTLTAFSFSGTTLNVTSPVAGATMTLVPGAAYVVAPHSNGIPFTIGSFPSLTSGTVRLVIQSGSTTMLGVNCSVAGAGTSSQAVTCELTAAQTALLTSIGVGSYTYQLNVTYAADNPTQPIRLVYGSVTTQTGYLP